MASLADALSMPIPAVPSAVNSLSVSQDHHQNADSSVSSDFSNSPVSSSSGSATRNPSVFEFTKRKRWADLLVTELSEAIILVLSPVGKVWYCGAAVSELLGWKDEDVVDREFSEYVNRDDIGPFQAAFQGCIHTRSELLTYIRLKCQPPSAAHSVVPQDFQATANAPVKEVLFEIKGYPHFVPDAGVAECKCFFMMAKPYPSRNTAMLNTFLELKMENQRLEERLGQLRALAENGASPMPTPTATLSSQTFSSSFIQSAYPTTTTEQQQSFGTTNSSCQAQQQYGNLPPPPEPTSFYSGSYEELLPSPSAMRFENIFTSGAPQHSTATAATSVGIGSGSSGEGEDDASARKKLKKSYGLEQYVCVTCGRTDSPEWRKGPNGPKTLCNACGLRWAKTVKTRKDAPAASGAAEA